MSTYQEQKIIRTIYTDINEDDYDEKVVLAGITFGKDYNYFKEISIIIEFKDGKREEFKLEESGENFNIFTTDITSSNSKEILLVGDYNKYGAFGTIKIFKYENNNLDLIFDNKMCCNKINYKINCLEDYKLEIACENTQDVYMIDINNTNKNYINNTYGEYSEVKDNIKNNITYSIDNVFPIKLPNKEHYSLLIQQGFRVDDYLEKLGGVQTLADINEDGELTIIDQYIMTKSY